MVKKTRPHLREVEKVPEGALLDDARLIHGEQLLVEPADFPGAIHKMDFKNPVPWLPVCAWIAHAPWILRVDVERDFVAGDSLVRELPDQVAGNRSAILPSVLGCQILCVSVKLRGGDVRMTLEVFLALDERPFNVLAKFFLERIVSNHEGPPKISFPLFEYWAEVEKDNFVILQRQVWRIFIVGQERVGSGPYNALVPMLGDSELTLRQPVNLLVELAFANAGPDQAVRFDGPEKEPLRGFALHAARQYASLRIATPFGLPKLASTGILL
jgi:hypothetical protein